MVGIGMGEALIIGAILCVLGGGVVGLVAALLIFTKKK